MSNLNSDGSVESRATSLNGAILATASVVRNGDGTATARVQDELGSHTITALDAAAIRYGDNTLPQGGTLYVDPNTNVMTAQVTSPSGMHYTVIATPNSDNTYTVSVPGTDGSQWQQKMAMPSGAVLQTSSAKRAMFNCQVAKDVGGYFGAVSMIAGGVALLGGGPIAAGVSGVTGDVGMKMKFFRFLLQRNRYVTLAIVFVAAVISEFVVHHISDFPNPGLLQFASWVGVFVIVLAAVIFVGKLVVRES